MSGIHGLPPLSYPAPTQADVNTQAAIMQSHIDQFSKLLSSLLSQPNNSQDPEFLIKMKAAILALAQTSKQTNGE